jgi:hypothetical protein
MGTATMRVDTEDPKDVVALVGRACSMLVEEYGWNADRLRSHIAAEVEDVIAEEPRLQGNRTAVSTL